MKNLMKQQEVEASSSLKTFHPFIDKESVLRLGRRLQNSMLPYHTMNGKNLPSKQHFKKLVVSAEHICLHHVAKSIIKVH